MIRRRSLWKRAFVGGRWGWGWGKIRQGASFFRVVAAGSRLGLVSRRSARFRASASKRYPVQWCAATGQRNSSTNQATGLAEGPPAFSPALTGFRRDPHHGLLRRRRDQRAIPREHLGVGAGASRANRDGRASEQVPFVHVDVAVKPHGMVKRRQGKARKGPVQADGPQRGFHHDLVYDVGKKSSVHNLRSALRYWRSRPHPHFLRGRALCGCRHVEGALYVPSIKSRSFTQEFGDRVVHRLEQGQRGRGSFRLWDARHDRLRRWPFLWPLKGGSHSQHGSSGLGGVHGAS